MTDNTQPEAGSTHIIRYALEMGLLWIDGDGRDKVREALDALDTLEAQLAAIGAGGVSGPLIGQPQAMPDLSQLTERGAQAWAGVDAQGLREGFTAADMATAESRGFRDGASSTAPPTAQAEVENLRKALQFYADKEHFAIAEEGAWDTVSGEPQNYWCDEAGTAMVEDGSIAKMALAGQLINFSDEDEDESAPPTSAEGVEHG